jgi:hypothetical protein
MGLLRRGGDAPRVVGFDFGPGGAAPTAPPAPVAPVAAPTPASPASPYAPVEAALAYAAAPSAPYAAPPAPAWVPPPPPGYEQPGYGQATPEVGHWRPGAPPPPSWGLVEPAPKSRAKFSLRGLWSVVAFAVFASGGYRAYQRYFGPAFKAPETIGSSSLMRDPQSVRDAKDVLTGVYNLHRGTSGVYGENGYVTMLLLAGDAGEDNAREVYDSSVADIKGESYSLSRPVKYGDVLCASLTGFEIPGVMCFWGSGKSDGLLLHVNANDLDEAARLTQEAWDAVEA